MPCMQDCCCALTTWLSVYCVWPVGQLLVGHWLTHDWILSPVSGVWQLTPSLLITSFTQTTGLLTLGPHNTTFSYQVLTVCLLPHICYGNDGSVLQLLSTFDQNCNCSESSLTQMFISIICGLICDVVVAGDRWLTVVASPRWVTQLHDTPNCEWSHAGNTFFNCCLTQARSALGMPTYLFDSTHRVKVLLKNKYFVFSYCNNSLFSNSKGFSRLYPSLTLSTIIKVLLVRDKVTTTTVDVSKSSHCGGWAVISHNA